MRLRNIPGSREVIADSKYVIHDEESKKGHWHEIFGNDNPIHIEIGMGKGTYIMECARRNPDINYIAIEKFDSVLLRALEKVKEDDIPNLRLCIIDAMEIRESFADDELDRIYLNFSDPWPKKHHAKRRLTSPLFLEQYRHILKKNGEIHFKTDNRGLFEYSLETFNECGYKLSNISLDLHKDLEKYPFNITTEFEDKWSKLGPIYRLEAKPE